MASPRTTSPADPADPADSADLGEAAVEEWLSLRPGVRLAADDHALYLVRAAPGRPTVHLGAPSPMKREQLRRLATRPGPVTADPAAAAFLEDLRADGWLVTTVRWGGRDRYAVQPLRRASSTPDGVVPELVLSRFAMLHREADRFVVESPLASARLVLHDPALLAVLGELTRPAPATGSGWRARLVRDLYRAGLAVPGDAEAGLDAQQWQPHALWFHARSRLGGGGYDGIGFGRTYWGRQRYAPLPGRRPPYPGPSIALHRPDLAALRGTDRTLAAVLDDRRSIRSYDEASPIDADQLGTLLYRCARARGSDGDGVPGSRPYPAGGASYELELYPVVRRVRGLAPGMYHYDPYDHALRLVCGPGPELARLLRDASSVPGQPPQVLIVLAARFGRLMHSYQELPYSLILKHVGVLYQTMYLVATSMGLAACALGAGDTTAFTSATGLDLAMESPVGEFALGSTPIEGAARGSVAAT